MKLTAARVLWLLAAMLAIGLVAEVASPGAPKPPPVPAQAAAVAAAVAAAEPLDAWITAILARPLFSPDRRPPAVTGAAAAAGAAKQPLPRLAGIIVSPRGRIAIFNDDSDHSTAAPEGASIGDWRVVAIHTQDVELTGPDGTRTVRPTYSAVAETASMPPPAFPLLTPGALFVPGQFPPGAPPPGGAPLFNPAAQAAIAASSGNRQSAAARTSP